MKRLFLLAAVLVLATAAKRAPSPLDGIAEDYVHLTLEAGEHEEGYVDAYYGPAKWQTEARANKRDIPNLRKEARALATRLNVVSDQELSPENRRRKAMLTAQIKAAETRLAMIAGAKFSFADEAEFLFGVRPALRPLPAYDPLLARIETLLPGEGPLWQRVDAFQDRYVIPADKVEAVMRAATAECRTRTVEHIGLPANERFDLELDCGRRTRPG